MKKSIAFVVALVFVLSFASMAAAAPNPFVDVPASHWSYDAVQTLVKAGVVDGYNDRTFRGDNTITRYELAQIVAKAMAYADKNGDKVSADQKKLIDKLAAEYSAELKNLGVRVAALEASKPAVMFMGQERITFAARNDKFTGSISAVGAGMDNSRRQYFTYRTRFETYIPYGKDVAFFARLRAQDYDVTTGAQNGATGGTFATVKAEQFWASWNKPFGAQNTKLTVGRQGLAIGKLGLGMAVGDCDLIKIDHNFSKAFSYTFMFGDQGPVAYQDAAAGMGRYMYNQVNFKVGKNFNFDIYNQKKLWVSGQPRTNMNKPLVDFNVWGVGMDAKITKGLSFFGEYAQNKRDVSGVATVNVAVTTYAVNPTPTNPNNVTATTTNVPVGVNGAAAITAQKKNPKAYWFGVTTGNPSFHPAMGLVIPFTKVGAQAWSLIYKHEENGAVPYYTNQNNMILGNGATSGALNLTDNVKGFELYYERILVKNLMFMGIVGSVKPVDPAFATATVGDKTKGTNYGVAEFYFFF